MDVRDIDLSWQPGIDETIDPFDLKVEFKEKGPILDQPSDSDKEPYDIAWDTCPDLTRKERKIWKRCAGRTTPEGRVQGRRPRRPQIQSI